MNSNFIEQKNPWHWASKEGDCRGKLIFITSRKLTIAASELAAITFPVEETKFSSVQPESVGKPFIHKALTISWYVAQYFFVMISWYVALYFFATKQLYIFTASYVRKSDQTLCFGPKKIWGLNFFVSSLEGLFG